MRSPITHHGALPWLPPRLDNIRVDDWVRDSVGFSSFIFCWQHKARGGITPCGGVRCAYDIAHGGQLTRLRAESRYWRGPDVLCGRLYRWKGLGGVIENSGWTELSNPERLKGVSIAFLLAYDTTFVSIIVFIVTRREENREPAITELC